MKIKLKPVHKVPKEITRLLKERHKFEKHIAKLMDKGYIKDWYYNGTFVVHFKNVSDLLGES